MVLIEMFWSKIIPGCSWWIRSPEIVHRVVVLCREQHRTVRTKIQNWLHCGWHVPAHWSHLPTCNKKVSIDFHYSGTSINSNLKGPHKNLYPSKNSSYPISTVLFIYHSPYFMHGQFCCFFVVQHTPRTLKK